MEFEADFYDGISPRAQRVLMHVRGHYLEFYTRPSTTGKPVLQSYFIDDCTVQAKLGQSKRLIDLPNGGRIETSYQQLESCLPSKPNNVFWRAVHYAENHLWVVVFALVATVIASKFMLEYGVPIASKVVATAIPAHVEIDLGKQTLTTLDSKELGYFEPSQLPKARQQTISQALSQLCQKTHQCPQYQLNFRKSPAIGANAFALPGGFVVMTDELVALAKNDDEIVAVLAHELGHVKQRHALRQTLQGTISGLIILAITGDASSIAAGLPAIMMNMRYSRDLESEADKYALNSLIKACIQPKYFATLLMRLENSHGGGSSSPEMISSHPDTKKRIIPFLKNHQHCN